MLILMNKSNNSKYHGTVGTPTSMVDSYGAPLKIGDVVLVIDKTKEYYDGLLSTEYQSFHMSIVCEEDPEVSNYSGIYNKFVYGLEPVWSESVTNRLNVQNPNNDNKEKARLMNESSQWRVVKIKDSSQLIPGEVIDNLRVYNTGTTQDLE